MPGFEHAVSSVSVNLGIASIAATLRANGIPVQILDLNLYENYLDRLRQVISEFRPQFLGFTVCTPQFSIAQEISKFSKDVNRDIFIICGGSHATALPFELLQRTSIDMVVLGEGDYTVVEVIQHYPDILDQVKGICFKRNGHKIRTHSRGYIDQLDALPYPALDLFQVQDYVYPSQSSSRNPVALIETSRGCAGRCIFCSRIVDGGIVRFKSPARVMNEMMYAKSVGFNEVHFADENFTADIGRATQICDLLIQNDVTIPWVPRSGIRVDCIGEKLFEKMKQAGCYHLPFGIESISQNVLNICNKGITIEQIERAIRMAKDYKFMTTGYFMVGLPEQTLEDITHDIQFAKNVGLDFVKFGATIPYPGTVLFNRWKKEGRILTFNWNKYHYASNPFGIYSHPNISQRDLERILVGERPLFEVLNCVLDSDLQPVIESPYGRNDS